MAARTAKRECARMCHPARPHELAERTHRGAVQAPPVHRGPRITTGAVYENEPTADAPAPAWLSPFPPLCYGEVIMIHENMSQSIEGLSARIIAIRDSL